MEKGEFDGEAEIQRQLETSHWGAVAKPGLVSVVDRDNPFVRASHGDQCLFRLSRRG